MNIEELLKKYDSIESFYNGFAIIKLNGKFGFINKKFKESKIIYDWVGKFKNGFALVQINGKCGFINENFEESKIIYDDISFFENEFARVQLNGKSFFINEKFEESKIIYDWASNFKNGFAKVLLNGKYGLINKEFKESKIIYDWTSYFKNGFASVQISGKWGFINKQFKKVTKKQVLSALCVREDKDFYYFKKILYKNLVSPILDFQYKFNTKYNFYIDKDVEVYCGEGCNIATESWIIENFQSCHNIYIIKVPKKNNTIVIASDMEKIRCKSVIITEEICS